MTPSGALGTESPEPELSASGDSRAFLQRRVGRFALLTAGINAIFLVYQISLHGVFQTFEYSIRLNALTFVGSLGVWALTRRGPRSARFLRGLEISTFLGVSAVYLVMGSVASAVGKPDLTMTLALTIGLMSRCLYVPSTARLTLILAGAVGVPLVVSTYLLYRRVTPEALEVLHGVYHDVMHEKRHGGMEVETFARLSTAYSAVWWLACSAVCAATSHVVHGLRREVRNIRRLGQYVLEERLGEGGMGIVYRAKHALLRRPTAIKLLPPDRAGAQALSRFEREVRRTASLTHPNTVTVFDYGRTPEGVFYYAMELLDGATLEEVVGVSGPMPDARVAHVLHDTALALAEAHGLGLIHRDIKPQNIMLCRRGGIPDIVKVLDFGLVKELEKTSDTELTQDGRLLGTPLYLSPEAITDPESVDERSDLYALGAVGYFLLTGTHVFSGKTAVEICAHHLHTAPVPPRERMQRAPSAALEQLVLDCLEKDPSKRPRSATELAARLRAMELGEWSLEEAQAFWAKWKPELDRRRAPPESESSRTIAIDLDRRGS